MRPLHIGYTENDQKLFLTDEDLETHVHGIGASRTGKSKLIEWTARELIRERQGFCLIDPHGFLYEDLLRWLTYLQPDREIILFNPSYEKRVVGFNPFKQGRGDPSAQADRRVKATVKAWGASNTDETPRLERILRDLYHLLIELGYSMEIAQYLFNYQYAEIRNHLISQLKAGIVRDDLTSLSALKLRDFSEQVESAKNRLFRFLAPRQIKRIIGLNFNNISLEEIIEKGKILLVNLQPAGDITEESSRLLGTLLLNEVWEIGKRRKQTAGGRPPSRFFLIIDEFQKFLTPDIPEMLDQGAKYGLHLFLFHQHLSQLKDIDSQIYGAVMTNARTKIVFGGLMRDDAITITKEIFPKQIDLKRIKFLIEQTKFWPVYTRDYVYTQSAGKGRGRGTSSAVMSGQTWNPYLQEWVGTESEASSSSEFQFENQQEGIADIPIFYPAPFKETTSITPYSLEETLWEMADSLIEQYQRHFFIRRPGKETLAAITPFVKPRFATPASIQAYAEKLTGKYLTPEQADREIQKIHETLLQKIPSTDTKPIRKEEKDFIE